MTMGIPAKATLASFIVLAACGQGSSDSSETTSDSDSATQEGDGDGDDPTWGPLESVFTIEVMVGTDSEVEARYDDTLPDLLESIEAQTHYMYGKLGPDLEVHFVVVRHEASVDQRGLELSTNKGELLDAWRAWADAENPADDQDPDHFDWSVLITATEFGSAGWGVDGPEGLCRDVAPAAIVNDRGHFAAKIIVHEAGHALTLGHVDGRPWIMNPAPGTGWEPSSAEDLYDYFVSEPACLLDWRDPPVYEGVPAVSREDQCQSRFSLPECPTQDAQSNCERLVCETDNGCKWDDSPPLDGTSCGEGEHCISGACVPA